ncbi:hypothetical protein JH06_2447 [Blastocystis sp. subtype 4]|uniref:hypothetical protein n=1 Tax=Blastocystis sp. subtype 4 TaxID=944170 RepID=UPI0007118162|nr:hypothetical protein JH06_2447 [Blastocystis sp. subtype 4]KNB46274.1 hypothetical protein JH06_2447 [Blastocystis sp. subtype 4]|eukprot:XP_014529755.1 hypothetical protein JH06_2447 [Blastocystis sp. subtype 4]
MEQSEKDLPMKEKEEETVIVAGGSLESTQMNSNDENLIQNHRILIRVFLSDLLTIVGKYMVYFENENALIPTLHEVDEKCSFLDLKKMESPSSVVLLYMILILSTIRSEESLILYLKKIRQFHDITLNFDLSVRLQSVLQNLSTSGGPLFPTVDVRHEAQHTINTLYPVQVLSNPDS